MFHRYIVESLVFHEGQIWEEIIIVSCFSSLYLVQVLYLVGVLLMTFDLTTCGLSQEGSGCHPVK